VSKINFPLLSLLFNSNLAYNDSYGAAAVLVDIVFLRKQYPRYIINNGFV
jgi:hypothetical protein